MIVSATAQSGIASSRQSSQAIADAGININFLLAQVLSRKYSAVLGFESEEDATKAVALIRKAAAVKR